MNEAINIQKFCYEVNYEQNVWLAGVTLVEREDEQFCVKIASGED